MQRKTSLLNFSKGEKRLLSRQQNSAKFHCMCFFLAHEMRLWQDP
jgi:hypothetical protein